MAANVRRGGKKCVMMIESRYVIDMVVKKHTQLLLSIAELRQFEPHAFTTYYIPYTIYHIHIDTRELREIFDVSIWMMVSCCVSYLLV
jgi:hypothetical protein